MDSIDNTGLPVRAGGPLGRLVDRLGWGCNLLAVVFNSGFAVLAIVTLCGIVFITRPKVVMHDIPPSLWLPLLIIMAPAQTYAQVLSWLTIFAGQNPTGPAIASRQRTIHEIIKPLVAFFWLFNFFVGFGVVVSLSKPNPGNPPLVSAVLVMILGSWLAFSAIVYLLLAIRTCTHNQDLLNRVWTARFLIALAMGVFGAVYYNLL